MKQYPHTLEVFNAGQSYQDGNGDWVTPSGEWEIVSTCREQPNGKGETVNGEDGQAFVYQSLVFLPKGSVSVKNRDSVRVKDSGGVVRLDGIVKRISFDQLHTRIWV